MRDTTLEGGEEEERCFQLSDPWKIAIVSGSLCVYERSATAGPLTRTCTSRKRKDGEDAQAPPLQVVRPSRTIDQVHPGKRTTYTPE